MRSLLLVFLLLTVIPARGELPSMLDWQLGYGVEYLNTAYTEKDSSYINYPVVGNELVRSEQRYSLSGLNLAVHRAYSLIDQYLLDVGTEVFWSLGGTVDMRSGADGQLKTLGRAQVGSAWRARLGSGLRYLIDDRLSLAGGLSLNYWITQAGHADVVTLPYSVFSEDFSEQLLSLGLDLSGRYYWQDIHLLELGLGVQLFSLYGSSSYKIITGTPRLDSMFNVGIHLRYGLNI